MRQQGQVNEAAEKFASALTESYWTVAQSGAQAQKLSAELTQNFFNSVIENLRNQAESNRQMTQLLADQQQRQQEATQALTQESVNAYVDFVNSIFSCFRGNVQQAEGRTPRDVEAGAEGPSPAAVEFMERFIEKYDEAFRNLARR